MEIIVLGTGCSGCKNLYLTVEKVISELGLIVTLSKEEDWAKIMEYNVMKMPALLINGKVVSSGKSLNTNEVKELLAKES